MHKTKNQLIFIKKFPSLIDLFKLSDDFVKSLENHQYFHIYTNSFRALNTDREKVVFILFGLIRDQSTCATIVQLLRDDNQNEVADKLAKFNESTPPMGLVTDVYIEVHPSTAPKKGLSNCYDLIAEKRGLCVIIKNMENQQTPDVYDDRGLLVHKSHGLKKETERLTSIFNQLFFEVEPLLKLSAVQIKERLTQISKDRVNKKDQAFVLIVISHGENEKVLGFNACEAIRKINFGLIEKDNEEVLQDIASDVVSIKDLIAIFSEENCRQLISKPKLHFYVCCRVKYSGNFYKIQVDGSTSPESIETPETEVEGMVVDKNDKFDSVKENEPKKLPGYAKMDTFVSFACAENYPAYFNDQWGMSYFGQALTHSIAQYACDEPLSGIMARTSKRLRDIYDSVKKQEEEYETNKGPEPEFRNRPPLDIGCFAIEVSTYAMSYTQFSYTSIQENLNNLSSAW